MSHGLTPRIAVLIDMIQGITIMLHPRELVFVLVKDDPQRTDSKIAVLLGHKMKDLCLLQTDFIDDRSITDLLKQDLLRIHTGFHEQLKWSRSLASRVMNTEPAAQIEDLLNEHLIDRIVNDLERDGVAYTFNYK